MPNPNIYAIQDLRWSNAGTTYNGIWLDLQGGAGNPAVGAAASRAFRLSNNGSNIFEVTLGGALTTQGTIAAANGGNIQAAGNLIGASDASKVYLGLANDVVLNRDAANTLALRNGTNAQTFNIYNTFTDASNYERFLLTWSANVAFITTQNAGTGSPRNLVVGPSGSATFGIQTNSTTRWVVDANGNLIANADASYNIGASGASRPNNTFQAGYDVIGVFTWGSISASVTPQEGLHIGCSSAATVLAGATVAASGTGHALLYYDGTQYKACN